MKIKHEYDLELKKDTGPANAIDTENLAAYSQEQIVKLLDDKG